jgi:hypothetical protein
MQIIEAVSVPYALLSEKIFPRTPEQAFVPFLGAGVSTSGRVRADVISDTVQYPPLSDLQAIATRLGLEGPARVFFSAATLLSCHLQARQTQLGDESARQLFDRLVLDEYPPTAAELAVLFSLYTNYSSLNEVVPRIIQSGPKEPVVRESDLLAALTLATTLTGVGWPPDALSTIAEYFEQVTGRDSLVEKLRDIFENKKRPTRTHELLAAAAKWHVDKARAEFPQALKKDTTGVTVPTHYLILTTNYDLLMERALENVGVPYVVLSNKLDTTDPQQPRFITSARFSDGPDRQKLASMTTSVECRKFELSKEIEPRVLLHKIHGCLDRSVDLADEGVVISDNDYVSFISQRDALPAAVTLLLKKKRLLFLGYSLNDWNVRSIFESLRRQRPEKHEKGDLCVTWRVKKFEQPFLDKNNINVLQTDLNTFSEGILNVPR